MNYSWLCLVRAGKPGCSASSPQISLCQTRCNKKHIIDVTFFCHSKKVKLYQLFTFQQNILHSL